MMALLYHLSCAGEMSTCTEYTRDKDIAYYSCQLYTCIKSPCERKSVLLNRKRPENIGHCTLNMGVIVYGGDGGDLFTIEDKDGLRKKKSVEI